MHSMEEQMAAMMEDLNAIKNKLENSNSITKEWVLSYPLGSSQDGMRVQNINTKGNVVPPTFPQYGLPLGYTPPTEEYSEGVPMMSCIVHINFVTLQANINGEPMGIQGSASHRSLAHNMAHNIDRWLIIWMEHYGKPVSIYPVESNTYNKYKWSSNETIFSYCGV